MYNVFRLKELLGYRGLRGYDSSWIDWSNIPELPIETGKNKARWHDENVLKEAWRGCFLRMRFCPACAVRKGTVTFEVSLAGAEEASGGVAALSALGRFPDDIRGDIETRLGAFIEMTA